MSKSPSKKNSDTGYLYNAAIATQTGYTIQFLIIQWTGINSKFNRLSMQSGSKSLSVTARHVARSSRVGASHRRGRIVLNRKCHSWVARGRHQCLRSSLEQGRTGSRLTLGQTSDRMSRTSGCRSRLSSGSRLLTRLYVSATSPRLRGLVALSNPTSGTICGRASRWVVYQLIVIHIKNAALAPTELGGCRKSAFLLPQDEAGTSAVQNTN